MWSDLREAARVKGTKSGTPPFQLEAGNQDQYGEISRGSQSSTKPSNSCRANQSTTEEEPIQESMDEPTLHETCFANTEDPEQAAFEEDNLNDDQK